MQLEDFYDYKNKLMEDLLTTPSIVNLIDEEMKMENSPSLAYTYVFPYEFIPETVEIGRTFICFDVDLERSLNGLFYLPSIKIWVFTHKSKLKLEEGGVRTDKLCSEISKKINGSLWYGLGELELESVRRFAPMTDFQGKCMTFSAKEFNRLHDAKKSVPVNRKG